MGPVGAELDRIAGSLGEVPYAGVSAYPEDEQTEPGRYFRA